MRIVAVTPPTSAAAGAAISLATFKAHLRVEHADEDANLQAILVAAFDFVDRGGRGFALRAQVWDYGLDGWPAGHIRLPVWPVTAASITYLDEAGVTQTLPPDRFRLIGGAYPALIVPALNAIWPVTMPGLGTVTVRATLGHANAADMPGDLLRAILLLAAHWYRAPEAVARNDLAEVPMGCRMIFDRYNASVIA